MSLGTVASVKDLTQGYTPLLLAAFTFQGQSSPSLLVSTVPLDGVSNPTFPGIGTLPAGTYLGRMAQQDIDAFQQRSRYGIDGPAKIKLHLYDADHYIWENFVMNLGGSETAVYGFRGASVQIALVMWQPGTSNFTSDAPIMFTGTCDMETPTEGGDILLVSSTNSHFTGTIRLPLFPIQNRCPLDFPTTLTQRLLAAIDPTSRYYSCGYSGGMSFSVVSATWASGSATLVLSPTFSVTSPVTGTITVSGVTPSGYNGTFAATFSGSSVTYTVANPGGSAGSGTVTVSGSCGNVATVGGPANNGKNIVDNFGNTVTDGSGIYLMCDFTRSNPYTDAQSHTLVGGCMARLGNSATTSVAPDGDLMHDTSGNRTGRFAGIEWSPQYYYAYGLNYVNQSNVPVFNFLNSAVLGQYSNLLYGTQWVTAKIANVVESGNDTKCEAMICTGDIGTFGVQIVTVNGVALAQATPNIRAYDPNLYWSFAYDGSGNASTGGRNGIALRNLVGYNNSSHNALGDPYGSIARILCDFYKDIFSGYGTPTINVLATGPQVLVYTDQTTYTLQGTPYNSNPAWVLLDILLKCNWNPSEIDMSTFIAAANYCSTSINYINQVGIQTSHARFKCQFCLDTRRMASEVIAGVLRCFNGYLAWSQTGKLQLFINQTLADSQSSLITGSNYNTAVPSVHADGTAGNGYIAYSFDETNIRRIKKGESEVPDIQAEENTTLTTPNQIFIQFQDEDNQYVVDSLGQIDTSAVTRAGGTLQPGGSLVPETITQFGISNFDQATRIANTYLAERQRGNEAGDPRGTRMFTIGTTVRCEHLRVGHLVWLTWQSLGINNQLFRVMKLSTSTNAEVWHITLQWHVDLWYTDLYGQAPQAFYSFNGTNRPSRAPLPWQPNGEYYQNSSLFGSQATYNFSIAEIDTLNQDGSMLVQMQVGGFPPVNHIASLSKPPLVPTQATTSTVSGTLPAGNYFVQLCSIDNTATTISFSISNATWDGTLAHLTVSPSPNLSFQQSNTITVSGVSVSGYNGTFTGATFQGNTISYVIPNPSGFGSGGTVTIVGNYSAPSGIIPAYLPSAGTITVSPIYWDANATGYAVFVGTDHYNITMQQIHSSTTPPSSISISAPLPNSVVFGPPDMAAGEVDVQAKWLIHAGVIGTTISSLASFTATLSGVTISNNLANHYLMFLGRPLTNGSTVPLIDFKIVSNSGNVLTLDRDPLGILQDGDVVVVTAQGNISSANTIGDTNSVNAFYPNGAFTSADVGKLIRIIAGTGQYQIRTISSVSSDGKTYTVSTPWEVVPDSTSVFIVEDTTWIYNQGTTTQINNSSSSYQVVTNLNVSNLAGFPIIIQSVIGDPTDTKFSPDYRSPFRMVWVFGAQGARTITTSTTQLFTDGIVEFNTGGITGSTTTLSAAITNTTSTSVSVTSGASIVNNTYITVDSESMYVQGGGGTTTLTVVRGQLGTTAATHLNGATVNVPGALTFTLLSVSSVPNVNLFLHKNSTDINYVNIVAAGGDTLPNGASSVILSDTTSTLGTLYIKASGV